ncbi:MAG: hypothetical protein IPF92_28905 [Myxococcales bacterium]|nr:hypothetical protein [Myxococcales bacterium]HQY60655.1 GDSL-type esterase/lipase family protein [Polyangiaceae bacterium]
MVPITRTPLSPLLLGLVAALGACSSGAVTVPEPEPDAATPAPTESVPSPPADSGPIGSVEDAGAPSDAAPGAMDAADAGTPPPLPMTSLGALVILGDSISDRGGQGPFYYELLRADLGAKFGAITYRSAAESGSKTSALGGQIDSLPRGLPGPVAVCITSGGNDMKAALPQIVLGADSVARAQVVSNVGAALTKLLAPGRFGAGVQVRVFEANVYDASDGKGDFGSHGCALGQGLPAFPTDTYFANWNGDIGRAVASRGQALTDLHGWFRGHGYAGTPSWYASDCTHPNTLGHDQLRRMFYQAITGATLP